MISETQQNAQIAEHIRRFGWHCLHVHPNRPDQKLFTYSIGFNQTYGSPEILVFGVGTDKAHALLSECASLLASGLTFVLGAEDDRVLVAPYNVVLKPVRTDALHYYCGTAVRYYGRDDVSAAVMFLPDRENRFPWNPAYDGADQAEAMSII